MTSKANQFIKPLLSNWQKGFLFDLFPTAIFLTCTVTVAPFGQVFEFNADEGINLMKGLLVSKGVPLYSQVWNDQPPLFSWILAGLFKIAHPSVALARGTVLFFSTVLVFSFFRTLKRHYGAFPALAGVIFLSLSPWFVQLSVSVMIGMVCLAFFMLSADLLDQSRGKPDSGALVFLSGLLSGLSLMTKFLTLPLVVFLIWDTARRKGEFKYWLGGFAIAVVPCMVFSGPSFLNSIFKSHSTAFLSNWPFLGSYTPLGIFRQVSFLLLLAIPGLVSLIRNNKTSTLPVMWFGVGLLVLLIHKPLFYYHSTIFFVPLAWLCAVSIKMGLDYWIHTQSRWKDVTMGIPLGICLFWFALQIKSFYENKRDMGLFIQDNRLENNQLIDLLKKNGTASPWVFSDSPMHVFQAGLMVVPEFAVSSNKRVLETDIDGAFFEKADAAHPIGQILLWRPLRSYPKSLYEAINKNFDPLPVAGQLNRYFIRRQK